MVKKHEVHNYALLEDMRVSYRAKDDSIAISTGDPDLKKEGFYLTLTRGTKSERAIRKVLEREGLIPLEDPNMPRVSIRDLIKSSLNSPPSEIITGEITDNYAKSITERSPEEISRALSKALRTLPTSISIGEVSIDPSEDLLSNFPVDFAPAFSDRSLYGAHSIKMTEITKPIPMAYRTKLIVILEELFKSNYFDTELLSWSDFIQLTDAANKANNQGLNFSLKEYFEPLSNSRISESSNILEKEDSAKIIMVAGTGGSGKTSVASSLADAFSFVGRKVLLIDGDIRDGQLRALYSKTNFEDNSFLSFMENSSIDFFEKLGNTSRGATLLTAPMTPRALMALSSDAIMEAHKNILTFAKDIYDVIIIDTGVDFYDPLYDYFVSESDLTLAIANTKLDYIRMESVLEYHSLKVFKDFVWILNKYNDTGKNYTPFVYLRDYSALPYERSLATQANARKNTESNSFDYAIHILRSSIEADWKLGNFHK